MYKKHGFDQKVLKRRPDKGKIDMFTDEGMLKAARDSLRINVDNQTKRTGELTTKLEAAGGCPSASVKDEDGEPVQVYLEFVPIKKKSGESTYDPETGGYFLRRGAPPNS
jgi:hypothetical protein